MISLKAFPTYAQYREDIILLALFSDTKKGFYVDVGANYPTIDSVTKLFYEKGWRGINIEPLATLHKQLVNERPRDINLQIGIGSSESEIEFYENESAPGHSSFDRTMAGIEKNDKIKSYKVPVKTLKQTLSEHKVKNIHFLKIDVEGFEEEVINGADWKLHRPEVICIEANHRETIWQETLVENQYRLFISDGLNEYYIAKESWTRTEDFADKVVQLDYNALRQHQYESWREDSKQLEAVTKLNQTHYELLQKALKENRVFSEKNRLSLSDRTLPDRLKRSVYGLTVDWLRYKRNQRSSK